jgi:heat shock protein HslJ
MKRFMLYIVFSLLASGAVVPANLLSNSTTASNILPAPTPNELRNMTYKGFEEPEGSVRLINGKWEGNPYVEGGASRPMVRLAEDIDLIGDLDGDRKDDAVVLLNVSTGGTGQLLHLAVVTRKDGRLENVATKFIGDRIQVRDARIQDHQIFLDVVQAGSQDPSCCPGELVSRGWFLEPGGILNSINMTEKPKRLTLETIGNKQWFLSSWEWGEAAPSYPHVTLVYEDGRFTGKSGCNNYFAPVKMGEMPGDVSVGPAGSTKMACSESAMAIETRFFDQLAGVKKFGFMIKKLALSYEKNGNWELMLFEEK